MNSIRICHRRCRIGQNAVNSSISSRACRSPLYQSLFLQSQHNNSSNNNQVRASSAVKFSTHPFGLSQQSKIAIAASSSTTASPFLFPRFFSTSGTEATNTVVDLLSREHAEEMENDNHSMPENLKELHTKLSKDWKIVDSAENAIVRMYKTLSSSNNAKVQVCFHCQDTVAVDHDDENEENGDDAMIDELVDGVKFTVTVTKAGQTAIFTCLSEDATVKIQSCSVSTVEDVETIIAEGGSVSLEQYQGPEFSELAEDLQDAFHEYLEVTVGLTSDFAAYVSMYTDHKEQKQYVQFLDIAKQIIKN